MITEDYVSFETAKLLKEKGFDSVCQVWYAEYTSKFGWGKYSIIQFDDCNRFDENHEFICYAPTLQLACKWLREVHKLHIIIQYANVGHPKEPQMQYWFEVVNDKGQYCDGNIVDGNTSYEEACETAIKYCLEKLI